MGQGSPSCMSTTMPCHPFHRHRPNPSPSPRPCLPVTSPETRPRARAHTCTSPEQKLAPTCYRSSKLTHTPALARHLTGKLRAARTCTGAHKSPGQKMAGTPAPAPRASANQKPAPAPAPARHPTANLRTCPRAHVSRPETGAAPAPAPARRLSNNSAHIHDTQSHHTCQGHLAGSQGSLQGQHVQCLAKRPAKILRSHGSIQIRKVVHSCQPYGYRHPVR